MTARKSPTPQPAHTTMRASYARKLGLPVAERLDGDAWVEFVGELPVTKAATDVDASGGAPGEGAA